MKIAIFEADRRCKEVFGQLKEPIDFFEGTVESEITTPVEYEAISIFIHSRITSKVLDLFPKLRYIQTRSTGFDHIDIQACKEREILVTNVQGYAGPAVAEFSFSLLLNHSRKTYEALSRTKRGEFEYKDLLGFELFGKRIGIVGLGTIGKQMARIASGFGMEIWSYTRHYDEEFCQRYSIQKCSFDELLSHCDVVMFAVPLTKETYHMLDLSKAKLLKKEAVVVNVARGEIINPEALEWLSLQIYGLGLDVIEGEKELLAKKPQEFLEFIQRPTVLYTPHMAYYTKEALLRIQQISLENMRRFLRGEPLRFLLT